MSSKKSRCVNNRDQKSPLGALQAAAVAGSVVLAAAGADPRARRDSSHGRDHAGRRGDRHAGAGHRRGDAEAGAGGLRQRCQGRI